MTNSSGPSPISIGMVMRDIEPIQFRFVLNRNNGVMAFCNSLILSTVSDKYREKVNDGIIPATERVSLLVPSVVTYAESVYSFRPIHSGVMDKRALNLVSLVLVRMYGRPVYFDDDPEVHESRMLEVGSKLIKVDSRLYVPFATDSYQLVWQVFARYTAEEAKEHLLAGIPVLH